VSRRARARRAAARARRGMSLVEVIVAFSIFGGALVALARYAIQFARTVNVTDVRGVASELAADRLETVRGATRYEALDSLFAETSRTSIPGYPTFKRQTLFRRVGGGDGDNVDYKVVTVIVHSSYLTTPVRRTTVIGDF
jgi:type II secretory pathway pseudopilin PulG